MSPISTTSRGSSIVAVIVILVALYIPVSSLDKYRWSGNFQIGTLSDTADTITLGKCAGSFLYARTTTASTTVTFCSNPGYNSQTPILWWSTYDTFQMTVTQPWLGESDASLTQNIHNVRRGGEGIGGGGAKEFIEPHLLCVVHIQSNSSFLPLSRFPPRIVLVQVVTLCLR